MTEHTDIPGRIRSGIAARGVTQTELAKRLGITKQSVGQVLAGRNPGTKHWPAIAKLLGCTVEWLANGTGDAPTWANEAAEVTEAKVRRLETLVDALTHRVDQLLEENAEMRAQLTKRNARG